MRPALRAEWTKLRTTRGPAWLLLAAVAVTVALGAAVTAALSCPGAGCGLDAVQLSLAGVYLGQAPVAILAVLVISGEHSTGLIGTTLTAVPRRPAVLAAKAAVVALAVAAAGGLAFLASLLVARAVLPGNGLPAPSFADGPTVRAYAGSVLYLVLIALLGLGAGAIVRDSAAAVGIVLGLLYLPPILALSVGNAHWQRLLQQAAPMNAGLTIQSTGSGAAPIGPWGGLAVLAAWAAGALLAGTLLLQRRDT
ncbi:ABC transporter permease [Dactylosporangium sp. NPDC049525]|uniref:ABC transporter permease n=1 Tax=Dactylosporangium sp. NPDC049525 TaxID=3154730 RepID=UPI003445BD59